MLTTMDSSPTGCSINTAALLSGCTSLSAEPCSSNGGGGSSVQPATSSTSSPAKHQKQDNASCAKRPSSSKAKQHSNRHHPYPDCTSYSSSSSTAARSPGSCSSDGGESTKSDDDYIEVIRGGVHTRVKRIAANSRERKRMHTVNSAFDQLRELVPTYPSNRKLSKIDTLRLACTYIQDLVSLLHNTQGIQGEDVSTLYHPNFPLDVAFSGYPVSVKQEVSDYAPAPFTAGPDHFRMQPAACLRFPGHPDGCPEPFPSNASDSSDSTVAHSPPQHHQFMHQQQQQQQQQSAPAPPTITSAAPPTTALPPLPLPPPPPVAPVSLGSRPPPLTRVSSEGTSSIHQAMADATISNSSRNGGAHSPVTLTGSMSLPPPPPPPPSAPQTSMTYQRQVNITSPLAMHSVHHGTSVLGHHSPPPVWQRPTPLPNGFALYGQ